MMNLKDTWPLWLALGDVLPVDARVAIAHAACRETDGSEITVLHHTETQSVLVTKGEVGSTLRAWLGHYGVLYSNHAGHPVLSRALRCSQVLSDIIDPELPLADPTASLPAGLLALERAVLAARRGQHDETRAALKDLSGLPHDVYALAILRLGAWCHVRDRVDLASICFEFAPQIDDPWLATLDRDVRRNLAALPTGTARAAVAVALDDYVAPRVDSLDYERLVWLVDEHGIKAPDERRHVVGNRLSWSSMDDDLSSAVANLFRRRHEQAFIHASNAVTQAFCMGTPSIGRTAFVVRGLAQVALGDYVEGFVDLVRSEDYEALHLINQYVDRWERVFIALEPTYTFARKPHPRTRHRLRAFLSLSEKLIRASSYPPPPVSSLLAEALCEVLANLSTDRKASVFETEAFAAVKAYLSREGWATSETTRRISRALLEAIPRSHLSRSSRRNALLFLGELLDGTTLSSIEVTDTVKMATQLVRDAPDQWFTLSPALHILGTERALESYQADQLLWESAAEAVADHGFERPWLTRAVLGALDGRRWAQWLESKPIADRVAAALQTVEAGQTDAAREIFDVLAFASKLTAEEWVALTQNWLRLVNVDDMRRLRGSFHSAFDAIWHLARAVRARELPGEAQVMLGALFPELIKASQAAVLDPSLLAPMNIPFDPEPSMSLIERLVAALYASGLALGPEQLRESRDVIIEISNRIPNATAVVARVIEELSLRDQYSASVDVPRDVFYYTAAANLAKALAATDHDRVRALLRAALIYGPRRQDVSIWSASLGIGLKEEDIDVSTLNDYLGRLDLLSSEVEGQEWVRELRPFPIAFRLHRTTGRGFNARIDLLEAFGDFENRVRAAAAGSGAIDVRKVYRAPLAELWRVVLATNPNASQHKALVDRAVRLRNAIAHGTQVVPEADAQAVTSALKAVQLIRPVEDLINELGPREQWQDVRVGAQTVARSSDPRTASELAAHGPVYSVNVGKISLMLTRDEADLLARWFEENAVSFVNELPISTRPAGSIEGTDISASGRYIDQYRGIALVVDCRNRSPKPLVILSFRLQVGSKLLHPSGLYGGLMIDDVPWWSLERLRLESEDGQRLALFFPLDDQLAATLRSQDTKGRLLAETLDGTLSGEALIESMRKS